MSIEPQQGVCEVTPVVPLRPVERRLLDILKDGEPHTKRELLTAIGDELAGDNTLYVHVSNLRKKLPEGVVTVCLSAGRFGVRYRMMKTLDAP